MVVPRRVASSPVSSTSNKSFSDFGYPYLPLTSLHVSLFFRHNAPRRTSPSRFQSNLKASIAPRKARKCCRNSTSLRRKEVIFDRGIATDAKIPMIVIVTNNSRKVKPPFFNAPSRWLVLATSVKAPFHLLIPINGMTHEKRLAPWQ